MNRLEQILKSSYEIVSDTVTFPIRVSIGIVKAISEHMPDEVDLPVKIVINDDNEKKPEHKPKEV